MSYDAFINVKLLRLQYRQCEVCLQSTTTRAQVFDCLSNRSLPLIVLRMLVPE